MAASFVADVVFGSSRLYCRRRRRRGSAVAVSIGGFHGGGEGDVTVEGWWTTVERVLIREVEGEEGGTGERA